MLGLAVFSLLACLGSEAAPAVDLKTCQETYLKNSEATLKTYQARFGDLQQQYRNSLEALKAQAVKQGDLLKTKAAIAELERFKEAKSLPAALDENTLPEIKAFQAAYVKQYSRLEQDMTAELGTLTAQYAQALERLEKDLTRAEKLDEATAVHAERQEAQAKLRGYADQMSALTATAATHALREVESKPAPGHKFVDFKKAPYLVVDLSHGPQAKSYPITALADVPKGGWSDDYKRNKLVLRRIEHGAFDMGSPANEPGRSGNETQHRQTLAQDYYIGVFEVTQRQWERVTGEWPSHFSESKYRECRPAERVSYCAIRGDAAGGAWPASDKVDPGSFLGKLRERTGRAFDLPTEAQWEYACRAGTKTALNAGKDPARETAASLSEVARCKANAGQPAPACDTRAGTAEVGSYLPNAWGLYDMHGNVYEWCLDWFGAYPDSECRDYKGALSGTLRVNRGGCWSAEDCRSAGRNSCYPTIADNRIGLRLVVSLNQP